MKLKYFLLVALIVVTNNIQAQPNKTDNYFEVSKNLELINSVFRELNGSYVDGIVPGKLTKKALDAMLDNLDPYTNYITEEDVEDYRFQTTGKYGGIGCSLRDMGDYVAIAEVYENSPADKIGIKPGDIVIEIDGRSTKGLDEDEIRKLTKGSAGTSFTAKIKNPITNSVSEKKFTRAEISVANVPYAGMVGSSKQYGYVYLNQFTERAGANVKNALDSLKNANPNMKGVILDLRGNPGGLLDEAVNLCNVFVAQNQLVVSTKGKLEDAIRDYKTNQTAWDLEIPLVVLINRGSASASEIVAGTMQDLDRGVIVGQKSFGKGLVQTTRELGYNAKLKLTTAKYYTPSGRCIQALDYTHRNEDGSVGEVADSLKSKFKTKNNREVFDGGGVDPDKKVDLTKLSNVGMAMLNNNIIFNYGNEYANSHPSIPQSEKFNLNETDYQNFIKWMEGKDFTYKTKTEEALEKMKKSAEKENYLEGIKKQIDELEKALIADKKRDLEKDKDYILRLLQSDIVSRYYYQKGRIENALVYDKELLEALKILDDTNSYNKILKRN